MTITLSPHQAAQTIGLIQDAIKGLDERLDALILANQATPIQDWTDDHADLTEQREFACRLKDHLIAQLGDTASPVWECPTEDCGWLNLVGETYCPQCGTETP